jgi:hypothetical protein
MTPGSEFKRAKGSRSRFSHVLSNNRSVSITRPHSADRKSRASTFCQVSRLYSMALVVAGARHGGLPSFAFLLIEDVPIVWHLLCRFVHTPDFLLATRSFYPRADRNDVCYQYVGFGFPRALGMAVRGRKAEDPYRGLRAGPASFPRLSFCFFFAPLLRIEFRISFSLPTQVCARFVQIQIESSATELGRGPIGRAPHC